VGDAMRLVARIELSEVNQVFLAAMAASNSSFVKKLQPFRRAVEKHIKYIAAKLPELAPDLCCDSDEDEQCCSCSEHDEGPACLLAGSGACR
jgi:hypothetical protein